MFSENVEIARMLIGRINPDIIQLGLLLVASVSLVSAVVLGQGLEITTLRF